MSIGELQFSGGAEDRAIYSIRLAETELGAEAAEQLEGLIAAQARIIEALLLHEHVGAVELNGTDDFIVMTLLRVHERAIERSFRAVPLAQIREEHADVVDHTGKSLDVVTRFVALHRRLVAEQRERTVALRAGDRGEVLL